MTVHEAGASGTIRDAVHGLMVQRGMDIIVGNPGSNELPFLKDLPPSISYVLALHEHAAVSIADGYAQARNEPVVVNLHAASGTGNGMGALTNAVYSHSKLVILAGQQVRATVGLESFLANCDATRLTDPLVKFSGEPLAASDVPRMFHQALEESRTAPAGPVYLSVPYDDWDEPSHANDALLSHRQVRSAGRFSTAELREVAEAVAGAHKAAFVVGSSIDEPDVWGDMITAVTRANADAWISPSAYRMPFPNAHPNFRGILPASMAGIASALAEYDVVVVFGAPIFRYHQYEPASYIKEETTVFQITDDPREATRAPFGRSLVGDVGGAVRGLGEQLEPREAASPALRDHPRPPEEGCGVFHPEAVFSTLRQAAPDDAVYVVESTSTNSSFWRQIDVSRPRSYYWPASGALGFGMGAAVGVQMADPSRPVLAIIGDGSANYTITALWTAAQYRVPVTFVILRNGTYGALKWFSDVLGVDEAPGVDIPGIDFCSIAQGYGVEAVHVDRLDELSDILAAAADRQAPLLVEVDTKSTAPNE